jgi:hypothetical protein
MRLTTTPRLVACLAVLAAAVAAGCGSSGSSGNGDRSGDGGEGTDDSGGPGTDGGTGPGSDTGTGPGTDAAGGGDGSTTGTDGGTTAGNPDGSCSMAIPAAGQPVDTSKPTTVVGTGTAASCTFSALEAAVTAGGIITFDCGSAPATIAVTATLNLPVGKNTVIDGGNKVTLDGGGKVRILSFQSPGWMTNTYGLTLQHITLINGKTTPTQAIPVAPAPCSQGWDDGQGGALNMRDGFLTVIDSIFTNNQAAPLGPDTGGGAIYLQGCMTGALIVHSTFTGNQASNAGAVGGLYAELDVYDSLFTGNEAIGHDANNNDPSTCSAMNNGQNEVGSGGNGGALYSDGNSKNILLCGDAIEDNAAGVNAFGGGLFFTSDNMMGTLTIVDTTMTGNTGGHWTNVSTGSVTNAGTAIGVNAKSITITNSTIQGVP